MSDPTLDSPLDLHEQPFALRIGGPDGADLFVERIRGREALSKPFDFSLIARLPQGAGPDSLSSWIEAPARVSLVTARGARRIHGIVARVTALGATTRGEGVVKIKVVPRLARLSLRKNSRIFQDRTPQEIVTAILDEGGVPHRFETFDTYLRRAYATQYEETDLAFVSRILAEVGIYYRFDPPASADPNAPETLVFADARRYPPVAAPTEVAYRSLASGGGLSGDDEHVTSFSAHDRMAPATSVRRTFDFRRPLLRLESRSSLTAANSPSPETTKEWFEHDGEPEPSEHEMGGEDARLEQLRRKARTMSGRSTCRRLVPGARFSLWGHETPELDSEYAVTSVTHDGRAADQATGNEGAAGRAGGRSGPNPLYENTFTCVHATDRLRPARPRRFVRHVIETAIVTGPEGAEIHADDHGRVKVRFLWDRAGTPDDRSSCWIRTSQLWSGEAWGAQFVPRVGMEVIVGFVQGDPDQPVILGCVPNAVRRLPFGAPTKSGIVTRSTPGGEVRNELSFEDRRGSEEVLLAAGRDLTVTSARNMATLVGGAQATDVRGSSEVKTSGDRVEKIGGDAKATVDGSKADKVALGWTRRAGTDIVESAGADYQLSVGKGYTLAVSGILGTTVGTPDAPSVASTFVHGDHLVRTSGTVKLVADQGISLVCGESRIDVRPDGVRIQAASVTLAGKEAVLVRGKGPSLSLSDTAVLTADKVQIFAEKGQILLDKHARMNGETVKLNCSDEAAPPLKDDGEPLEMRPFRTKLTDHSFSPYKDRTYHLVADGVRYEGKTNAEGVVDKPIPKDTKLIEITVWIGDYPQGERQLFVIRRGYSPPDSVDGAQSRLASLGYLKGARSGAMDDATRDALYSFQLDAGLPATGLLDARTAAKLAAVQGG